MTRPAARSARAIAIALAVALSAARPSAAQVAPDARWLTIRTEHFRVHFTAETEPLARRAAANAERAYAALAAELVPPRGTIDLVVSDDVDFTNGYALTFPSNRIVVYANPPVDQPSLRQYDDWNALVVSHELAHVFHLDRAAGWWGLAQRVFGRSPILFPNQYLPGWVTEGIAIHYETKLTGSGRIAGTQHRSLARAAALGGAVPALGALSAATPVFPGGETSYAYGGLFIDHLARTRGDSAVRRYIESVARTPLPFLLNHDARRGFGVSFARAWDAWRDTLRAQVAGWDGAGGALERRTDPWWQAQGPRWTSDTSFVVGGNTGVEVPGAYRVAGDDVARLSRRNDASPNAPLPDGRLVYAQLDFTDPYRVRSDLYVAEGGRERRLTRDERLSRPDVRADGAIVAVRTEVGATHLVRTSVSGGGTVALTVAAADTHWSEPRWSPAGDRIAAVRWSAGGISEVVVLDTLGAVRAVVSRARAVHGAPSFAPDGRTLIYAADTSGRMQLYEAAIVEDAANGGTGDARRLAADPRALFHPSISPDGRTLAAVRLGAEGYEVVVADVGEARAAGRAADPAPAEPLLAREVAPALPAADPATAPARGYSPWRSLVPTYWMPVMRPGDGDELFVGAATSMRDVIGRHAYTVQAFVGTETRLPEFDVAYTYTGLGRPLLAAGISQGWDRDPVRDRAGTLVGELRTRERTAYVGGSFARPRVRTSSFVSAFAELGWREFRTVPDTLVGRLAPFFRTTPRNPALQLSAGFGNAQRPLLSVSPEDGVAVSGTARQRWLADDVRPFTRSAIGAAAAYRSLPFMPGFAHHVLAARVAGGWADDAATSEFEVGGVSGGTLEVVPGVTIGEGVRTFGVRGVPVATQQGTRAVSGTLEYRAPLFVAGRGLLPLPLFVDRASLALFGDAGAAWCPPAAAERPACAGARTEPRWLSSVGAEVALDVALQYDVRYRFRLGVAAPRADARAGASGGAHVYLTVGSAF